MTTFFATFLGYDLKLDAIRFGIVKEGQDLSWREDMTLTRYGLMGYHNVPSHYSESILLDQISRAIAEHHHLEPRDVDVVLRGMPK